MNHDNSEIRYQRLVRDPERVGPFDPCTIYPGDEWEFIEWGEFEMGDIIRATDAEGNAASCSRCGESTGIFMITKKAVPGTDGKPFDFEALPMVPKWEILVKA